MSVARNFREALFILLALLPPLSGAAEATSATPQGATLLHLSAQPLAKALIELSTRMDLSIIFDKLTTRGIEAPAIDGTFTAGEAIARLLEGSGLEFELLAGDIYSIRPRDRRERGGTSKGSHGTRVLARAGHEYPQDSDPVGGPLEEISVTGHYVTGSRVRRESTIGSAPIDILSLDDIELSGAQSLSGLFKYLPAVVGNSTSTAISNGGDGTATVTLRGLPASHTLVLIDGRRTAHDGLAGESADLNSIPLAAVERVEVLKDGASAIYGSDAIAGVVNVITKKDYAGFNFQSYWGETSRHDLISRNFNLTWGKIVDRGSVLIGASLFDQGSIHSRDRSISRSADDRPKGGIDKRSSATPAARITVDDEAYILRSDIDADGSRVEHFRIATDDDRYNFREATTATVPFSHQSFFLNANYDANSRLSVYVQGSYTRTKATNLLAPVPLFTGFEEPTIKVSADNIYNPFGVELYDVRRRLVEFGPREQLNRSWANRFVTGFELQFDHYTLEFSSNVNITSAQEQLRHILRAKELVRALGPSSGCTGAEVDGCVPLNLFGPPGSIDEDQVAYLQYRERVRGFSLLNSFGLDLTGALALLPAGDIEIATGLEYRTEAAAKFPDRLTANRGTVGGTNFESTDGRRHVAAWYGELLVPVFRNSVWGKRLLLELASRISHYNDFGKTVNPRLGVQYTPWEGLLLRSTYAEGFKAPTLDQQYGGLYQSFDQLNDPCSAPANVGTLKGCNIQSDPTLVQFLTIKGGNSELEPERSRNVSMGLIWTPVAIQGLGVSVDFYRITQRDVVDASAQYLINQNAADARYTDRVLRDANGNIRRIVATQINVGWRAITGLDLTANYSLPPMRWGTVSIALNAAHIITYVNQNIPDQPEANLAGTFSDEASEGQGALPRWKANLGMKWRTGRWESSYTIHFVGSLTEEIPAAGLRREIDEWMIHDAQINYRSEDLGLKVTIGIDNLLDKDPPFSAAAFNDSYDARTYELKGRYFYSELALAF